MAVSTFDDLMYHVNHEVEVATYGHPPVNIAVECVECGDILFCFDKEE
jgi:hypothetical protein